MNFKPNMLFLNRSFDKKRLKALLLWFRLNLSENAALKAVEILQGLGFRSATQGAISLGLDDLKTPTSKGGRVFQAQVEVALAHHEHHRGNRTPVELFQHLVDTWHRTSQDLTTEVVQLFHSTERVNPVYMMAFSGARGNISQVRQLVGMRGLMADPRGQIVGFPILSNFREGLTITEYFVSCYGARKGVVDTAIRTADAGYLTRRLADVSHHVVVRTTNCGTHESILLRDIKEGQKTILSLANRLVGRVLAEHVFLPASPSQPLRSSWSSGASAFRASSDLLEELANEKRACYTNPCASHGVLPHISEAFSSKLKRENKIIIYRNAEITSLLAEKLAAHYSEVPVRSPLSCSLPWGVCQLCYGWGLSEGRRVTLGEAVGIIAAQSIGEPGTQLTLRTFHTGGVFSGELLNEIRAPYNGKVSFPTPLQGLLLRTPHGQIAFLTKVSGKMKISETEMHFASKRENLDTSIPLKDSKDDRNRKASTLLNPQLLTSPDLSQYMQKKTSNSLGVKPLELRKGIENKEELANQTGQISLKEDFLLQQHEEYLEKEQIDKINELPSEFGLSKQNSEFLIQPSTVIFVKQKEHVVNNQLLAEFSSSTLQSVNDQIEITQQVLSDIAGQIWFKELEYGNRKGPGSGSLGTYFSSQKLGGIWVLAGKPMIDTYPNFASPPHTDTKFSHKCSSRVLGYARPEGVCISSSYKSLTLDDRQFAPYKIQRSATCTTRSEKVSSEYKAKSLLSFASRFAKESENSQPTRLTLQGRVWDPFNAYPCKPEGTGGYKSTICNPKGQLMKEFDAYPCGVPKGVKLPCKGYDKSLKSFIPLVTIVRGKQKLQIENNISSNIIKEINASLKSPFTLQVNINSYDNMGNKYKSQIQRLDAKQKRDNATTNVVIKRNEEKVAELTPCKPEGTGGLRLAHSPLRSDLLKEELASPPILFPDKSSSLNPEGVSFATCKGLQSNSEGIPEALRRDGVNELFQQIVLTNCDNEIINEVSATSEVTNLITSPSINIFTNTNILLYGTKISFFNNCDRFLVFNNFILSNLILSPKINESLLKRKNLFKYHIYGIQNKLKRSRNTRYSKTCSLPLSLVPTYASASIINLEKNYGYSLQSSDVLKHDYVLGYSQTANSKRHIPSIYFSCETTFQHNFNAMLPLLFKYRKNNKFIIYASQQRDLENQAIDKFISNECQDHQTANNSSIVLRRKLKRNGETLKQSFAEVNKSVKVLRVITLSQYVQSKITDSSHTHTKSKSRHIPHSATSVSMRVGYPLPLRNSEGVSWASMRSSGVCTAASTLRYSLNTALGKAANSWKGTGVTQRRVLSRLANTRITHDKFFERIENKIKKTASIFQELRSSESKFILMENQIPESSKKLDMLPLLSESDLVTFVTNYGHNHTQYKSNAGQMLFRAKQPAGAKIQTDDSKRPLQDERSWQSKEKLAYYANQRRGAGIAQSQTFSRIPQTNLRFSMRVGYPVQSSGVCTAKNNFRVNNSLENVISLSNKALNGRPILPPLAPYFNKTSFSFSTSLSSFNVFSNCNTRSLLANYYFTSICSFPSPVGALLALSFRGMQRKPLSKMFASHVRGLLPCRANIDAALLQSQKPVKQKKAKKVSTTGLLTKTWGLLQLSYCAKQSPLQIENLFGVRVANAASEICKKSRRILQTNRRFSMRVGGTATICNNWQALLNFPPKSYLRMPCEAQGYNYQESKGDNNKAINYINKSYLSTILINKKIIGDNRNSKGIVLTKNNSCDSQRVIPMDCFVSQGNKSSYFFTEKRRLQSTWIQKKRAYLTYLNQVCSIPFTQQFTKNSAAAGGYTTQAFTNFISRTNLQFSTFNDYVVASKNSDAVQGLDSKRNFLQVAKLTPCKPYKSEICMGTGGLRLEDLSEDLSGIVLDKSKICKKGNPSTIARVFPGQLITYGDNITNNVVTTESGQVLYIDSQKTTIRKAQTVLIYSQAIIAVLSGDWIKKGTPLMSLSYQKLVTGDIVQGLPKIEQFFEAPVLRDGTFWGDSLQAKLNQFFQEEREKLPLAEAVRKGFSEIQRVLVEGVLRVYISQGVLIADKHLEVIVRQMTCKGRILYSGDTGFLRNELVSLDKIENVNQVTYGQKALYHPQVRGITDASLESESFLSAASFQETTRVLSRDAIIGKTDLMRGLKERVIVGELIQAGTGLANNSVYNLLAHSEH